MPTMNVESIQICQVFNCTLLLQRPVWSLDQKSFSNRDACLILWQRFSTVPVLDNNHNITSLRLEARRLIVKLLVGSFAPASPMPHTEREYDHNQWSSAHNPFKHNWNNSNITNPYFLVQEYLEFLKCDCACPVQCFFSLMSSKYRAPLLRKSKFKEIKKLVHRHCSSNE